MSYLINLKAKVAGLQEFYLISLYAITRAFKRPYYTREAIEQMDYAGAGSFFIVVLVSLFIGMALSLQLSAELSPLGLKMYTGRVVGLSIIKEIGPVAIALSFTGRVGAGIASELGSMQLGHQVDILKVLGIDPIKKLVTPRVISSIVMLPVLTVIGDAISLLGSYYIAVFVSHQSSSFYWSQIRAIMTIETVTAGTVKPFIFGYLIACISCYTGLSTKGGAIGLRRSTTTAVVFSIIIIIVTDFILTRILLSVFGMEV
jgi:phospholipid/cholesterol/gamma-HCH transport system permease protein